MKSRLARVGLVAVGLLALLGITTPPAHAITASAVAFVGTATLGSAIGYPCTPTPPDITTHKCQPTLWTPAPLPGLPLPTYPWLNLPNRTTFGFGGGTACTNVVVNVAKAGKGPVGAGGCGLTATGTVLGFCGLSQGHGTATFTDAQGQTYTINFHFTGVGSVLVVDGQVTKNSNGASGTFVGAVQAFPPTPVLTPTESCTNKTALTFTITGGGVAVGLNL